jgi:hypothetical protein
MKEKTDLTSRLAIVLISVLIASCGEQPDRSAPVSGQQPSGESAAVSEQPTAGNAAVGSFPTEESTWAKATVANGDMEHLQTFDQKLKELLGDSNLEAHGIRCSEGCEALSGSTAPEQLVYFFPREALLIFEQAWDATQTSKGSEEFSITIDAKVPATDCPSVPPAPTGCRPVPGCSDGCGRVSPVSCTFC